MNWTTVKLGDVVSIKHGWPFKSEFFSEEHSGRPIVVNIGNFRYDGGFRFESTKVKEYTGEYPKGYELSPSDILLVMTCQTAGGEILGIPGRIPNDGKTYLHNQRLGKVEITAPGLVDADFLYWVFLTKDFNNELFRSATGTKILHTAPNRIENYDLPLPPIHVQHRIADILWSLEEKIELTRQMNETLEKMLMALYKHWFVDFGPFQNEDFIETEHGMIPKGWTVGKLGDAVRISTKSVSPSRSLDEEFYLYSIPSFDSTRIPERLLGEQILSSKYAITEDTILVSKLNPSTYRIWSVYQPADTRAVSSTEFINYVPLNDRDFSFFNGYFRCDEFVNEFCAHATGTTGSRQRVAPKVTLNFDLILPSRSVRDQFDDLVRPMWVLMDKNIYVMQHLSEVRNYLNGHLLSGKIDLNTVQEIIDQVRNVV